MTSTALLQGSSGLARRWRLETVSLEDEAKAAPVASAGTVSSGSVTSRTVIVWLLNDSFPQLSTAFQVRVST